MRIDPKDVWLDIQTIKELSPLIHNITNYVVMELTANALLAVGASPVMAHAIEEAADMAKIANTLVLNIGTLSPHWIEAMLLALQAANQKKIPVVFDPVGAGATPYRTEIAKALSSHGIITAIRGNASEIVALGENSQSTKGVDSTLDSLAYLENAEAISLQRNCIIWMSGKTDVITDGRATILIDNGHPLMGKVTGMGCTATAITGAFLAVNPNPLLGCAHAALLMGIAGEMAAQKAVGPGSFKLSFIDALYQISLDDIEAHMCVRAL